MSDIRIGTLWRKQRETIMVIGSPTHNIVPCVVTESHNKGMIGHHSYMFAYCFGRSYLRVSG